MKQNSESKVRNYEDEEIATEITPESRFNQTLLRPIKIKSTIGIAGLFLAILSLFVASLVLAPISIILGYVAHRKGDIVGFWSIIIGVFSLLGTILLIKFI